MNKTKIQKKLPLKILSLITFAAILIAGISAYAEYNCSVKLTQFSGLSHSQMMGYAIVTKNDKLIIIDGGTTKDTDNIKSLANSMSGKIDYWFITHPHKDHAGVLIDIINNTDIKINNIYVTLEDISWYKENDPSRATEAEILINSLQSNRVKKNVHEVYLNQKICIDNLTIDILGVKNPEITNNATNNSSMVLQVNVGRKSILFLGDTGKESSDKLVETYGDKLKCDILQISHHGQNGATKELYELASPKICMWPTPEWLWNNDSGLGEDSGNWKTKETRAWIDELGVEENIVAKDGNATIRIW